MAAPKLLSVLALASLLIVALSFGPLHANALVADRAQVARHVHARDAVAKRKRSDSSSLCLPKPSSSVDTSLPTSTSPPSPPTPTTSLAPSTTSATPSPTSPASNTSGKKFCLAWGADSSLLPNFARPNVGFYYNWGVSPPNGLNANGMVGMPMLWGYSFVDAFVSAVVNGPDSPGGIALGPNEPNEVSQSNMSPQDAVNLWMSYMMPLKAKGYSLASPACTDDDIGLTWYAQFYGNCSATPGCEVDYTAFHSYNTDPQHLITYATTLYNSYGRPVMITEFADQDYSGANNQATMDEVWTYANTIIQFVDTTSWILCACPFGVVNPLPNGVNPDNALLDASTGYPTDLGYTYFG